MTTYSSKVVACGACGYEFSVQVLSSTSTDGPSDLDGRPAEMMRFTMETWIQWCRQCGFRARDVSVFDERMRSVLQSPEFSALAKDPALVAVFACAGMLAAAAGDDVGAGRYYLSAAWDADDRGLDMHARYYRQEAADAWLRVLAAGGTFAKGKGESEALLVDCLRRARRDQEAEALIGKALAAGCDGIIADLLAFQRKLIRSGDRDAHVVSEALE
jgi:hypothetical protein